MIIEYTPEEIVRRSGCRKCDETGWRAVVGSERFGLDIPPGTEEVVTHCECEQGRKRARRMAPHYFKEGRDK